MTYLVFPFTVTTIFDTFKCEEFPLGTGDTRRFLAKDLSLDCDAWLEAKVFFLVGLVADGQLVRVDRNDWNLFR